MAKFISILFSLLCASCVSFDNKLPSISNGLYKCETNCGVVDYIHLDDGYFNVFSGEKILKWRYKQDSNFLYINESGLDTESKNPVWYKNTIKNINSDSFEVKNEESSLWIKFLKK